MSCLIFPKKIIIKWLPVALLLCALFFCIMALRENNKMRKIINDTSVEKIRS
jgi:hypothetical protein